MSFESIVDRKLASLEHALDSRSNSVIDYSCISIRVDRRSEFPTPWIDLMDNETYFYKRLKSLPFNSAFFGRSNYDLFSRVTENIKAHQKKLSDDIKTTNNKMKRENLIASRSACKANWIARRNFKRLVLSRRTLDCFSPEVLPETEGVYYAAQEVMAGFPEQSRNATAGHQREIEGCALNFALAWGLPRPAQLITGYTKFSQLYRGLYARQEELAKKYKFSPLVELPKIVFLESMMGDLHGTPDKQSDPAATRSLMVFE